ncbi:MULTISPECIES: UDP-N-acetylmuramoyl-L-alanyl-D-glutamate--2,6-diaminopimelate ligase [Bacillaceae]|uniref:UDP-N-acetylmuramoyl-L-alanyl-D-glutamate--2, 6-diaminopimelate ligase n=1 Tax=Bacillaceae TaxID=186817 RepID=UPI001C565FCE|nr:MULTISPECIES: UDP-N-acetylmuramoyl-L-alanyl-D-glutamate--2,6-diaminopimelate ligase [Rossellomorea]MBW3113966.1 UDP-N-acetylmuramoyl-L-alanyl-D-glutamate--2,6-diaminopimelate ligase [Bacillus sp. MCCB 382]MDX8343003.1 UDP-N-acetylmuramoyl-L-alanyl-D-glutamate--2,6-diaminopimelate ligase [Rossellomorea sp. YZS02]
MRLHTLLEVLPFFSVQGEGNPAISNIANHHKKVKNGDLFICINGLEVDSHSLSGVAEKNGAAAILAERTLDADIPVIIVPDTKKAMAILADYFYKQPSHQLLLVGVTGTNGKTTTTHLIDQVFTQSGMKTGLIGTMHIKVGDELEVSHNTTPDSLTLQRTFRRFCDKGVRSAIMEVSSHALDQGRVHGCDYDIAVFTNLSQDHLDYHKSMDDYRNAKGLLFSQLGNTYFKKSPKYAIINKDDEAADYFIRSTAAHVLTYGLHSSADFFAKDLVLGATESVFTLVSPFGEWEMVLKYAGKFNVYNALAALATAFAAGIPIEDSIRSLEKAKGVRGRFETVSEGQPFSVIIDYAHTPDGLKNVLETTRTITNGKVIVVVGCGGDRDRIKRPIMAEIACDYGDYAIFTSDNPRTEDPVSILKDMESGVFGKQYQLIIDRKEAIKEALNLAQPGDVVLIAGKGHETYQIIGNDVFDFDDREVARNFIKGM